jgi:ADP-heptose:LPS heptosyltransferase
LARASAAGGYPNVKGAKTEIFLDEAEESLGQMLRKQLKDRFFILWAMSGSGLHKAYPWSPFVAGELNRHFDDIQIITVGDSMCKMIEWNMANTMRQAGNWTIRQSLIGTKYADLVIGPETGILNGAACFDTPKIVFLSHSTEENLTKYWKNCTPIYSKDCKCYPCHRLITSDCCPKGDKGAAAICMESIHPVHVYNAVLEYYKPWREAKEKRLKKLKKSYEPVVLDPLVPGAEPSQAFVK